MVGEKTLEQYLSKYPENASRFEGFDCGDLNLAHERPYSCFRCGDVLHERNKYESEFDGTVWYTPLYYCIGCGYIEIGKEY